MDQLGQPGRDHHRGGERHHRHLQRTGGRGGLAADRADLRRGRQHNPTHCKSTLDGDRLGKPWR